MKIRTRFYLACSVVAGAGWLAACGGGSGTAGGGGVALSGNVAAPNGALAFSAPPGLLTRLAALLVPPAIAQSASGTFSAVGAGVTVSLIEVDASGNQVGAALATTTTLADGSYSLTAPQGFTPSSRYVVRAASAQGTLDAVVTGTSVNVDPVTSVVTTLVLAGNDLSAVSTTEVVALTTEVRSLTYDTSLTYTSAADATSTLQALATTSQEIVNVSSSIVAGGVVSGTVRDGSGNPMADVKVVVRDYRDWVTRAVALTDANGAYTVNVPASCGGSACDYIVGAFNGGTASYGASEWWTAGGGAPNQFDAGKTTVAAGTPVTRDFVLDDGVRIVGTVTGAGSNLGGIKMLLRDYDSDQPLTATITRPDGSYVFNAPAGRKFTLTATNDGGSPFATQYYAGPGQVATAPSGAVAFQGTARNALSADFSLPAGKLVTGVVKDNNGVEAPGMMVRISEADGTLVNVVRTDLAGVYRHWVPLPGASYSYNVYARGQKLTVDAFGATTGKDFTSTSVHQFRAVLADGSNTPLSQAKLSVYDGSGNLVGTEISASDGTVVGYSNTATIFGEVRLDGGQALGSALFGYQSGSLKPFASQVDAAANLLALPLNPQAGVSVLGTLNVPAGNALVGTVTNASSQPLANAKVLVKVKASADSFGTAALFIVTRSQSDGSFSISLPTTALLQSAGGFNKPTFDYYVCAIVAPATTCNKPVQRAVIQAGSSTSVSL